MKEFLVSFFCSPLCVCVLYILFFTCWNVFIPRGGEAAAERRGVSLGSAWGGAASGGGVAVSASVGASFKAIPKAYTHTSTRRRRLLSHRKQPAFSANTPYHNNRADNADRSPTNPTFKSTKTTMRKMQARKPAKCLS